MRINNIVYVKDSLPQYDNSKIVHCGRTTTTLGLPVGINPHSMLSAISFLLSHWIAPLDCVTNKSSIKGSEDRDIEFDHKAYF